LWRELLFVFGSVFSLGVVLVSYDLFTLKQRAEPQPASAVHEGERSKWWRQPLSVFEMAAWLVALWFIGFILTGALLTNNLSSVRLGDPSLPYLLAGIGYPALVIVSALFALRFLRACEVQPSALEERQPV
jgi:nitric oxide reductase subunit B